MTEILAPGSPVYTVTGLKHVQYPPYTCAEKLYSAFRGPKPNAMFHKTAYFEKELVKSDKKPPRYCRREPLYLYHGERKCAERRTAKECRAFLANHFFSAAPWNRTSKMSDFHRGILTDENVKEQLVKWFDPSGKEKLYPVSKLAANERDYRTRNQYKNVIFEAPTVSDVQFKRLTEDPKKVTSSYKKSTSRSSNDVKSTMKSRKYGKTAYRAPNRVSTDSIREMLSILNQPSSAAQQRSKKLDELYC